MPPTLPPTSQPPLMPELSLEDYAFLQSYIERESGIALGQDKLYLLKSRLLPVVEHQRLRSLSELCQRLRANHPPDLRRSVVEAMTTHETLFFRDPDRTVLANMKSAAPALGETDVRKTLGSFLFSGDDVDKPARVLSGGEKTRLSLAMLVVSSANVLLLDEPTNNLDPASRQEILGALRTYKGAVVLVTHDEGAVEALEPERVLLLPDGVEDFWGPDYRDLVALA